MAKLGDFGVGVGAGSLANVVAIGIGAVTCGDTPGEIPPFVGLLVGLWVVEWAYLGPVMLVMLVARRWWMALGVLAAGLAAGALSLAGLGALGTFTV
jgi:hypothetical protein